MTLRIGMIGAGIMGQTAHIETLRELPGVAVTALADLRPGLRHEVGARYGIPGLFETHRDLLAGAEVDAVFVCTPRPSTGPVTLDALRAGRHVLAEKPMAHTVGQARRLVQAAAERGLTYAVGYMKRHDPGYRRAKQLFDELRASGELGSVRQMRVWCHGGDFVGRRNPFAMTSEPRPLGIELWPTAPDWLPESRHADYAQFLNVHSHDLNILRDFLGSTPAVVSARLGRPTAQLIVLDGGGFDILLETAVVAFDGWHEGIAVLFERGSLTIELPPPMLRNVSARATLVRGGGAHQTMVMDGGVTWAFREQAAAFVEDVRQHRAPRASGADAVADLELAEAIWRLAEGAA